MPDPVELSMRPASGGDEDFIFRVYASTRAAEMAMLPAAQQDAFLRMQYRARSQSYAASYPEAKIEIARCGGTDAGYLITAREPGSIRLVDIAFLPEFRGKGLGGRALLPLIAEGLSVRLSVLRGNPAIRLYERLGFSAISADAMYIEMEHPPCTP
jgi:ribosomal protein S18 acetylase RimI-like enzyme